MLRLDEEEADAPAVQVQVHSKIGADEVGEHVNDLAFEVADLDKSLKKLQHKAEHDLLKVKGDLEKIIKKLEDGSDTRLKELEKARELALDAKLEARLAQLETELHTKTESRIAALESKLGMQVKTVVEEIGGGGGWKMPLFLVVVVLGAYMAYTTVNLNKINRRDKLI
jgi:hypothetical protein